MTESPSATSSRPLRRALVRGALVGAVAAVALGLLGASLPARPEPAP